jgi:hypothetical protein
MGGEFICCIKRVIDSENSLVDFKIGHEKESETLEMKIVNLDNSGLFLCDSPGYNDSRGKEIDISNCICISNATKSCLTVRPVLLINFHEIKDAKGGSFLETLNIVKNYIKDLEKYKTSI